MLQSPTDTLDRPHTDRPNADYMQHGSYRTKPISKRLLKSPPPLPKKPQEREVLREALQVAMNERRYGAALTHLLGLVALDPSDPRWPHKYGDLLQSLRRTKEAAAVYRRTAACYEGAGFPVRAEAMRRLALELEGKDSRASEPKESGAHRAVRRDHVTVPISHEMKALLKAG